MTKHQPEQLYFIGYVTAVGKHFTDVTIVYVSDTKNISVGSETLIKSCLDPGYLQLDFDAIVWGDVGEKVWRICNKLEQLLSPPQFIDFLQENIVLPNFEKVYKDIL